MGKKENSQMTKISNVDIKAAISKSGYLEEQKVTLEFEKQGFYSGANYAFEDQDEQKSRKIDFIANKYIDFEFGKTGFYFLIYGEVKKRTNPLIFFERKPHEREYQEVFIQTVATQEFFPNIDISLDVKKILNFHEIHHQAKYEFISTQFCEIYKGKAEHRDFYEKIFVPLLKCVDSEIINIRKPISYFDPNNPKYFLNVFQPVIVISGPIYAYDINTDRLVKKKYILYRRHYTSKTIKRTLLFDIISKDYLSDYISEKLIETYKGIENSFKSNIAQIFDYCMRDQFIQNQKIAEMWRKQAFR